jgi:hypothetical protein
VDTEEAMMNFLAELCGGRDAAQKELDKHGEMLGKYVDLAGALPDHQMLPQNLQKLTAMGLKAYTQGAMHFMGPLFSFTEGAMATSTLIEQILDVVATEAFKIGQASIVLSPEEAN